MLSQIFEDAASRSLHTQTIMIAASELLPTLCKMLQALPTSPLGAADHQKVGCRLHRQALQADLLMLFLAITMAKCMLRLLSTMTSSIGIDNVMLTAKLNVGWDCRVSEPY